MHSSLHIMVKLDAWSFTPLLSVKVRATRNIVHCIFPGYGDFYNVSMTVYTNIAELILCAIYTAKMYL